MVHSRSVVAVCRGARQRLSAIVRVRAPLATPSGVGLAVAISIRVVLDGGVPFSRLVAGERLDDLHTIASVEVRPYRPSRTYDILPASSTGTYFAAGALVASTLAPPGPWGSGARPAVE